MSKRHSFTAPTPTVSLVTALAHLEPYKGHDSYAAACATVSRELSSFGPEAANRKAVQLAELYADLYLRAKLSIGVAEDAVINKKAGS